MAVAALVSVDVAMAVEVAMLVMVVSSKVMYDVQEETWVLGELVDSDTLSSAVDPDLETVWVRSADFVFVDVSADVELTRDLETDFSNEVSADSSSATDSSTTDSSPADSTTDSEFDCSSVEMEARLTL